MPNARPTPGLRLTPERRAEIRHAIRHNAEVDAQDALDLLHDLDVLEREVERLRAVLQKRLVTKWRSGHRVYYQCDECGQRADAPERIEHIACPLSDAALAERGGEG